jgi:hypothetical protein
MPKSVKVLIIWIPTGKTHFLWHLEVRRVIFFYPTMKFALLFLAPSYALGGPPASLDGGSSIQGEDENPSGGWISGSAKT